MKEKTTILLAFALSLMLCSCGNTDSNSETITSTTTTTTPVSYTTTSETSTQSETTTTSILTTTTSETDSIIETESSSDSTTTVTTTASTTTSTKKATTTSIKVTAYDAIMFANTDANIRSGNGTQYDIVHTVKKNTTIRITGICENGWYKVTVNDIEGYMSSTVLSEEKVTTTTTTTAKKPETTTTTTTKKTETIVTTYTTDFEYKDAPYYDYDGAYHMVDYINQIRRAEGVGEVVSDEKLMEAARIRAKELSSYFAHNRPNGDAGISIIWDYYLDLWYMGENIAMNSGYSPYGTFMAFYNSDGHRKTMLDSDYTLVGIGYYYADDGLLYCCQLFGGYDE